MYSSARVRRISALARPTSAGSGTGVGNEARLGVEDGGIVGTDSGRRKGIEVLVGSLVGIAVATAVGSR